MSALASFFIVPRTKFEAVKKAAKPMVEKRLILGIFPKTIETDTFWEVLQKEGREVGTFDGSGWVFNDLNLLLEERNIEVFPTDTEGSSDFLTETRGSTFVVFDAAMAGQVAQLLTDTKLGKKSVRQFLVEDYGPDAAEGAEQVLKAKKQLISWLSAVDGDNIGLLSIG